MAEIDKEEDAVDTAFLILVEVMRKTLTDEELKKIIAKVNTILSLSLKSGAGHEPRIHHSNGGTESQTKG